MRRDGAESRRQRISELARTIQAALTESGGEIPFAKTVSVYMKNSGLTKERVLEYLEILRDNDEFEIDMKNDKIKRLSE